MRSLYYLYEKGNPILSMMPKTGEKEINVVI